MRLRTSDFGVSEIEVDEVAMFKAFAAAGAESAEVSQIC
jgi:hypothetical protein